MLLPLAVLAALAVAALTSIEERAKTEFHRSARVASLGFDSLPPGYYLAHLVGELRAELQATRLVGGAWLISRSGGK